MFPPSRIVCLTEETVETLYLLGEQDRIVGISGYVVRPPEARREKPRVSAFTSANIDKILALHPDLALGAMVDASERARQLVGMLEARLAEARSRAERLPKRPKLFFEEWDDPLISGIGWVSEPRRDRRRHRHLHRT